MPNPYVITVAPYQFGLLESIVGRRIDDLQESIIEWKREAKANPEHARVLHSMIRDAQSLMHEFQKIDIALGEADIARNGYIMKGDE